MRKKGYEEEGKDSCDEIELRRGENKTRDTHMTH